MSLRKSVGDAHHFFDEGSQVGRGRFVIRSSLHPTKFFLLAALNEDFLMQPDGNYSLGNESLGILTSISITAYKAVLHSKCKD